MPENLEKNDVQSMLECMKAQEKSARKALWHQRIRTILVLVLVIAVVSVVGPIQAAMNDVQLLTQNANYAVADLLNTVEALDLENSLDGIDALVADSSEMIEASSADIEKSLQKIANLDIDGLNESIKALEAITTTIGRFFGYKG